MTPNPGFVDMTSSLKIDLANGSEHGLEGSRMEIQTAATKDGTVLVLLCRHVWECLLGIVETEGRHVEDLWNNGKDIVSLGGRLAANAVDTLAGTVGRGWCAGVCVLERKKKVVVVGGGSVANVNAGSGNGMQYWGWQAYQDGGGGGE
jgi:hypothetical protein